MTAIAQMQVRFDAAEDRLLLRVRSGAGDELRFWLTRRYVRLAWPPLRGHLERTVDARVPASTGARRAMASFEHQDAVQNADFQTPFSDTPSALPLGDAPVLLARFGLRQAADDGVVLLLHPQAGQGAELALSKPLLHSFCKLLTDAVRVADWQMDVGLPVIEPAAPGGMAH